MDLLKFLKTNQEKIALIVGFLLIAGLGFFLGRITALQYSAPEIKIDEVFSNPFNNSQNLTISQPAANFGGGLDCQGKIKGNINTNGRKLYHMPNGAFYTRTNPEMCFNTEAEATAAGFVKSSR